MTRFQLYLLLAAVACLIALVTVRIVRAMFRWRARNRAARSVVTPVTQVQSVEPPIPVGEPIASATEPPAPSVNTYVPPPLTGENPYSENIYSTKKTKIDRLPRVEAADVPHVGTDDYRFGSLTPTLAALLPESEARKQETKTDLIRAGYYQPHAQQNLAAMRYLGIIVPMLFFGALLVIAPKTLEAPLLMGMVVCCILGWALPRLNLRSKAAERKNRIEFALPDMIDMINMCVSQGMTLATSLKRVTRELHSVYPELSQELDIVSQQAEIGTMEHALQNFRSRVDVPDVHSFTSLLIQTERMGTSVTNSLSDYAETMRESLRQRADEKANRATFRLLFPTVLCLMPAVFMFLVGPSLIELTDFFTRRNSQETSADTVRRISGQNGPQAP